MEFILRWAVTVYKVIGQKNTVVILPKWRELNAAASSKIYHCRFCDVLAIEIAAARPLAVFAKFTYINSYETIGMVTDPQHIASNNFCGYRVIGLCKYSMTTRQIVIRLIDNCISLWLF